MSGSALLLEGVTRRFGRKIAVDRLDLAVPQGVVVGLLGQRGASCRLPPEPLCSHHNRLLRRSRPQRSAAFFMTRRNIKLS